MASTEDNILLNQIVNQGVNIYGSREKIRSQLIQFAKQYLDLGNADIQKTSYLAYLIDMLSILSANQLFYDSTIYKEFFMVDAQLTESVYNLARWIGYSVPKATAATVNIMFVIPLNFTVSQVSFSFSKYFKCKAGDIPFTIEGADSTDTTAANVSMNLLNLKNIYGTSTSTSGTIINNSVLTVRDYNGFYRPVYLSADKKSCSFTLPFVQEEVIIQSFSIPDTLAMNQFYNISVEYSGQVSAISVWICSPTYGQTLDTSGTSLDGILDADSWDSSETIIDSAGQKCSFVEWTESTNGIYTMSARAEEYTWVGSYNKGQIFFGNGIVGKQPTPGSIVVVKLHVTQGSSGNVIANTITTGDPLYIELSTGKTSNMNYSCTNYEPSSGGEDILSIAEIKKNAITNLSSKQRLVSDQDYNDIQTIVGNSVPLSDCLPILKRSDIKINEIMAFTILNYTVSDVNEIVPTRNATIDLVNPTWSDDGTYVIPRNYQVTLGPSDNKMIFYTIFNMTVEKATRMAYYDYILQKADGVNTQMYVQKVNKWNQQTYMTSTGSSYSINLDDSSTLTSTYPLAIQFDVNHIATKIYMPTTAGETADNDGIYDFAGTGYDWDAEMYLLYFQIVNFRCKMTTKWGTFTVYDSRSEDVDDSDRGIENLQDGTEVKYITKTYKSFAFQISDYTEVPDGTQRFEYNIQCYAPEINTTNNYIRGYVLNDAGEVTGSPVDLIDPNGNVNEMYKRKRTKVNMVWQDLATYYCDIIVRRDMSECMQSSVTVDKYVNGINAGVGENVWHIHNVPTIYSEYYDAIKESSDDTGSSNFEVVVMQKLIDSLKFDDMKMLTDFINIKFADTYGILTNLRYNTPSYYVESRYTHTPWWANAQGSTAEFPEDAIENEEYIEPTSVEDDIYYIVNGKIDGNDDPLNEYIGYIARRDVTYESGGTPVYSYQLIEPEVGMFVKVRDELDSEGNMQTCIWNGRIWKTVDEYTIPLELKLKVEVDESVTGKSDTAIKESVISTLSSYFESKMGLQQNLDRSEIIRVCRSVEGVSYAELVSPEFDIRFDYEVSDLEQEDLLKFTPQYVGFRGISSTNTDYSDVTIDVDVVRK